MLGEFLCENVHTVLIIIVVYLAVWYCISRPPGIPPGPRLTVPILGNLLAIGSDPVAAFKSMRSQYGDLFSLYMGSQLVIIVNGYDVIKEMFVKKGDLFLERPRHYATDIHEGKGIICASGIEWKKRRKFAMTTLREFGLGRKLMEDKIHTEIDYFLHALKKENGQAFDLKIIIHQSMANVICDIVIGKRFSYEDPHFRKMMRTLEENFKSSGATTGPNFIPLLRYLPWNILKFRKYMKNVHMFEEEFVVVEIEEHERAFDDDNITDFLGAYLKEMKEYEQQGKPNTILTKDNLIKTVGELVGTGSETSAVTIRWAMVFFLRHPQIQEKCFSELCNVVGRTRLPRMSDRSNMPYMEATVMEIQRRANIVPISVWRGASSDVIFRGYRIPKGVTILPNINSVMMDPEIWKDPEEFRPERFLNSAGRVNKPDEFIPFFVGPRSCLGEPLARMELFLFISAMVQTFQFVTPEGESMPSTDGILGITFTPNPFKMKAVLRS